MSDFMREALPIMFMFCCVLALGPLVGFAMWMAFDGDRLREDHAELPVAQTTADTAKAPSADGTGAIAAA